eukprot:5031238-Prymnesium_polylepis.1
MSIKRSCACRQPAPSRASATRPGARPTPTAPTPFATSRPRGAAECIGTAPPALHPLRLPVAQPRGPGAFLLPRLRQPRRHGCGGAHHSRQHLH